MTDQNADSVSGVALIVAERARQIESEEWTSEHDDEHGRGELARAAGCYIVANRDPDYWLAGNVPVDWPWDSDWWKPSADPVRNLVKAGALIAAEIDRLHRVGL